MAFSLRNLRFRCAISWIQSFYDDVAFPFPREVLSYPYTDLYTFTIRKELIWWLTKGDPYFCIIAHLSEPTNQLASFEAAILSLPAGGAEMDAILLARSDPFVVEQHLALVEGIMGLCSDTSVRLESVAVQLQKLSGSWEHVESIEEGLVSWLRLVCSALRKRVHLDKNLIPEVTSLTSCLSNGCLLLLLMHFYIPQCIQLSNGKFPPKSDDSLGLEDSFHNGTLVSNACMQIPPLKFCLSPQAIVRSSDPLMLPYVTVSLVSMFVCFQLAGNEAIYGTPALYGALIGQAQFPSRLMSSAKFHSMDSVATRGFSSTECLVDRNRLITPSAESLLASQNSNAPGLYPRDDMSRTDTRPSSRFRTPVRTIKSFSTPDLSRAPSDSSGLLRVTQDLTESGILKIAITGNEFEIHSEEGVPPAPRVAWSPLKQPEMPPSLSSRQKENSSCGSIPSRETVASLETEPDEMNKEFNEVIRLNIFPVTMETIPIDSTSQLLRMGAIKLTADQSNDSDTIPRRGPIHHKLGQLAFSYLLTNQEVAFEEYICSQLNISSIEQINEVINSQSNFGEQTQDKEIIAIPINATGNQVTEPQTDEQCFPTTHKPIEMRADCLAIHEKSTKPLTFYSTGNDVPDPLATERAKNMLRMLENRNTTRQVAKQTCHSAKTIIQSKLQSIPTTELITPSISSHSLQSIHSNDISTQLISNHAQSTQRKPARAKNPNESGPLPSSKHKSNKQITKNALCDVCLAGGPNSAKKMEILSSLSESRSDHFLILFRDIIGCKFRGLYAYSPEEDIARRIGGSGPRQVTHEMLVKLYKYNSGAKEFQEIPARRISSSIDAFTIQDSIWVAKKKRL